MENTMSLIRNGYRLSLLCLLLLPYSLHADTSSIIPLKIETIAQDLGVPWGMALLPDNTMLITQREGILSKLDLTTGDINTITGLPSIKIKGQGGLFDVAIPPDYASSKWVYFSYSKDIHGKGATTLSRAKLNNGQIIDWSDILITQSTTRTNVHYGGRISFDNDGHLFLTIGDRGVRKNAQNLLNHAGSILRLNIDGSIPHDNPFINSKNALNEIWSYGHRNPQGMFYNIDSKQLWAIEHGPRGGDEINIIHAGHNYGWPIISYGQEYTSDKPVGIATSQAGMEQPIKTYVPSIAPSGLVQYSGKAFTAWENNLLTGSMKLRHLNRIVLDSNDHVTAEIRLLRKIQGRIRNVIEDAQGWLYVSTDDGRILRISPQE